MASLTFSFQQRKRSVSLDGLLKSIPDDELEIDWKKLEPEFRKKYLISGHQSGSTIYSIQDLHDEQELLPSAAEDNKPSSFIGYLFETITRIVFYAVIEKDFAFCEVFEFNLITQSWSCELKVP